MKAEFKPSLLKGTIEAIPSKSYGHRLMIAAALACGESIIEGIAGSEDMLATIDCIKSLGADVSGSKNGILKILSTGKVSPEGIFPCRESGSTLRFFIPIALVGGGKTEFNGVPRLIERGIGIYEELLAPKGIAFFKEKDGIVINGRLSPGEFVLRGDVSSQFVTGLLFALPLLEGDSIIRVLPPVESRAYIDITIDVLKTFGIKVEEERPNTFKVFGKQTYKPMEAKVEGDWSNAAALFCFNKISEDNKVEVLGLNPTSKQGDKVITDILESMVTGKRNEDIDISDCPDLGPVLFATAAAQGGGRFIGTKRLAIKESDRAKAMASELLKFGVETKVYDNSVIVEPGNPSEPTEILSSHNDHRIVMALSLLCCKTGGIIDGVEAINKSYPRFFEDIKKLGAEVSIGD